MYSSKKKENRRSGRLLTLVLLALAMPLLAQETTLEDPILSDTAEAAISEDTERLWEEQLKTELDKKGEEYTMLVMPDHPTPLSIMTHISDPVPFIIYNNKRKLSQKE